MKQQTLGQEKWQKGHYFIKKNLQKIKKHIKDMILGYETLTHRGRLRYLTWYSMRLCHILFVSP